MSEVERQAHLQSLSRVNDRLRVIALEQQKLSEETEKLTQAKTKLEGIVG